MHNYNTSQETGTASRAQERETTRHPGSTDRLWRDRGGIRVNGKGLFCVDASTVPFAVNGMKHQCPLAYHSPY